MKEKCKVVYDLYPLGIDWIVKGESCHVYLYSASCNTDSKQVNINKRENNVML